MNRPVPDYFTATADLLEHFARKIREGENPQKFGREVELLGIIMGRRT